MLLTGGVHLSVERERGFFPGLARWQLLGWLGHVGPREWPKCCWLLLFYPVSFFHFSDFSVLLFELAKLI
jgi:hypothetical protein